ncbi:MAG: WYL domain-containing protein [Planctomycetes bacterium]|nr:WYL domain-containing protein [Planctomycetota bacterium]
MAELPRHERILDLAAFLLKQRAPTAPADIRRQVAGYGGGERADMRAGAEGPAAKRLLERDVEALRALGYVVDLVSEDEFGNSGYLLRRDESWLPRLALTGDELLLLNVLAKHAPRAPKSRMGRAMRSALVKLRYDHPLSGDQEPAFAGAAGRGTGRGARRAGRGAGDWGLGTGDGGRGGRTRRGDVATSLDRVLSALAERRVVAFVYPGSGGRGPRRVAPYGVGTHEGEWYVVGLDAARRAVRTFNLSRVSGTVRMLEPENAYEIPESFDVRDHVGVAPWRLGAGSAGGGDAERGTRDAGRGTRDEWDVTVAFDAEVAWLARDHFVSDGGAARERVGAGGRGEERFRVRAGNLEPLFAFLAPFGARARVVAPAEAAREYRRFLDDVAAAQAPERAPARPGRGREAS